MNKQILLIMFGALAVALLVAVGVQKALGPSSSSGDVVEAEMLEVLVAAKKLSIGDEINDDVVEWKKWPEDATFKGMVLKSEQETPDDLEIYGKLLRRGLDEGEPVSNYAIVMSAEKDGNFLAARLKPGMRAVGVAVKAATSVGGFVSPGDYVDVILTYKVRLRGDAEKQSRNTVQRFASETILNNVRVMAVDQLSTEGDREAKIVKTVTVEVDKKGAEVIALALNMGDMSLALRSLGDEKELKGAKTLTTDVTVSSVLKEINNLQDKASVNTNTVRVYKGNQIQNVPVRAIR